MPLLGWASGTLGSITLAMLIEAGWGLALHARWPRCRCEWSWFPTTVLPVSAPKITYPQGVARARSKQESRKRQEPWADQLKPWHMCYTPVEATAIRQAQGNIVYG